MLPTPCPAASLERDLGLPCFVSPAWCGAFGDEPCFFERSLLAASAAIKTRVSTLSQQLQEKLQHSEQQEHAKWELNSHILPCVEDASLSCCYLCCRGSWWMRGMDCAGSSQPCLPAAASCSLSQLGLKAVPGASEVPPLPWKVFITVLFVLLGEMISL